jgi:hypothetical protein
MANHSALAEIVDGTVEALIRLDLGKLQDNEARVLAIAGTQVAACGDGIDRILAKKRVLELVLKNAEETLDTIRRLSDRKMAG